MKTILRTLSLAALLAVPFWAQAQNEEGVYQRREVIIIDEEEPRVVDQRREVIIRDEPYRTTNVTRARRSRYSNRDRLTFFSTVELGYNGLVQDLGDLKLPGDADFMSLKAKSINFNLMIMNYDWNITRWLGLRTGIGLEVNNFRFDKNITLKLDDRGYVAPDYYYDMNHINLQKTKLVNCYLNVPLVLRLNISRTTEIYGGMVGGWRWNSYTKVKSSQEGKHRYRNDLNLRNFHYGYTAGIVFDKVGFYATYYPHSIFKADKGPEVRQVNIGVSLRY